MATRKTRTDSATAAIKAIVAATAPSLKPPKHVRLRKEDMPFWEGIIKARAREEWNEANLVIGAQLARCQYEIEKETQLLETEGSVVVNDRGTRVMNPRHSILEQLARREMALMRALRMGGSLYPGDKRRLDTQRKLEESSRETVKQVAGEEDLLAK